MNIYGIAAVALAALVAPVAPAQSQVPIKVDNPHIAQRCRTPYKHDLQRLQRIIDEALPYYEAHEQSEQALVTELVALQSQPDAKDLIPVHQLAAAQFRSITIPIVEKAKDTAFDQVKFVRQTYRKCFATEDGKDALNAGADAVRGGFRHLWDAHGELFEANMSVEAGESGSAQQNLTEASVDFLTVEHSLERGMRMLRKLQ